MRKVRIVPSGFRPPWWRWLSRQGGPVGKASGVTACAAVLLLVVGAIGLSREPSTIGPAAARPPPFRTSDSDPATARQHAAAAATRLRVLFIRGPDGASTVNATERALVAQYARGHGLTPVWSAVSAARAYRQLRADGADVLLGVRGSQPAPDGIARTLSWGMSRQQVVGRADTGRIRSQSDLYTREIAAKRSSPVWPELQRLARSHPTMGLVRISETESPKVVLNRVSTGRYDLAVLDSLTLQSLLPGFLDLRVSYNLTEGDALSWAVRDDDPELLSSLNQFLNRKHLEIDVARTYRDDLPGLRERKTLRLITCPDAVDYYFDYGRLKGFEYDLVKRFAESHGMRLDVVVAHSHEEMKKLLLEGRGDVVAASLPEDSFGIESRIAYTRPYNYSAPVVVARASETPLTGVQDLAGRRVVLPAESPYLADLERLRKQGIDVQIAQTRPGVNTEATLFRVAHDVYDLTVIGSQQATAELDRQVNLKVQFPVTAPEPLVWAVRRSSTQLQTALNAYLGSIDHTGFYNVLYTRYITRPDPPKGDASLLAGVSRLSPYDDIVREYAERYDFDWRLIVAQMYQESRFDPSALSDAGAIGLMQLLPATAELFGGDDVNNPKTSIEAAVRYLNYLRGKFEDSLLLEDRTWFTLAAYNAGFNRVQSARRLAEKMHLDGNRWFDNVELAMIALSRPYDRDGETVRACRCGQTAVYVRNIRTLYNNYVRLTTAVRTADDAGIPDSRI